jgi:putative peptide zinc metalloprotease protein
MNLNRALDVSLPELPARRYRETYFRFDPRTVVRYHEEPDRKIMRALAPSSRRVMNFTLNQWELVKQFDGRRSYEQLAEWWKRECGVNQTADFICLFAESLDEVDFWYKTPQEESVAMMEELREKRRERKKQVNDFSRVYLYTFDPDEVLTKFYNAVKFVYSRWFVAFTLLAMVWMVGTWIARSDEVWRDTVAYWNMTEKTFRDVLEFYLTFLVVGFFHESGHALTVKHFGGQVRRMGLLLIFTTPAFFVDMSQIWLYRSRRERCLVTLAGFWVELAMCALATVVWTGTPQGGLVHDWAYKFILVGGIMPVLFNMNPLMRLDGYLFCCEFFRMPNLREKSIAFLTAWVRKNIFRMPVTVPHLPLRRALLYTFYGFFAGLSSYLLLLFLARLTYRVFNRISPDWAFLPATLVALRIFKSRIITFRDFVKALHMDKKELLRTHRGSVIAIAAAVLIFLFLPLWHDSIRAPFILEPIQRAVVRAEVPGRVEQVLAAEGQKVQAGAPLARLRDLEIESEAASVAGELKLATARATQAELRYTGYAVAEHERQKWAQQAQVVRDRQTHLLLSSPISGTVVTPHMGDLLESFVAPGTTIAEVQDVSVMRARIFVPEPDMRTLGELSGESLHVDTQLGSLRGRLESVSSTAEPVEPGMIPVERYKGIRPPPYYVALFLVPNADGALRAGMVGEAKIFGKRRSLAGLIARPAIDFISRRVW